jgi:hypothetical protein
LTVEHKLYTLTILRECVDTYEEELQEEAQTDDTRTISGTSEDKSGSFGHVYLGSMRDNRISLAQLQQTKDSADTAFHNFRFRLNKFLNEWLPANDQLLPESGVRLRDDDTVILSASLGFSLSLILLCSVPRSLKHDISK